VIKFSLIKENRSPRRTQRKSQTSFLPSPALLFGDIFNPEEGMIERDVTKRQKHNVFE
jgi:hypothetical protein